MLNELRRFNDASGSLEDALGLSAYAKMLRAEYVARQIEVPEWLDVKERELNRFILLRTEEARAKRLSEIRSQLAALETPTDKRARLEKEREALEKQLAAV